MPLTSAPIVSLCASGILGTSDFLGGLMTRRHPAVVVVAWSHLGSLALLTAALAATGWPPGGVWLWWSVLAGLGSGIGLLAFYTALAVGTVGVVSSLAALGVLIPVGLALATGEQPAPLQLVGIVLALAGAALSSGPEIRHEDRHRARAVALALFSAICFGLMTVGIVRGAQTSNLATMWGMRATSGIPLAVMALVQRRLAGVPARDVALLTLLGTFDVAGNALMGLASGMGLVSVTVVLSSLYPVVTILLAGVFLHERLRTVQFAGVATALTGVVLMNLAA